MQNYIRDERSNAVINIDDKEYQDFVRERAKLREIKNLNDRINQLEKRLSILEEKNR